MPSRERAEPDTSTINVNHTGTLSHTDVNHDAPVKLRIFWSAVIGLITVALLMAGGLNALQSAVVNGPRFLGKLDRYGSIDSGKAADLLALDADPLADIGATRRIHMVVSRGQPYDRARLDAMLDEVRRKVAAQ